MIKIGDLWYIAPNRSERRWARCHAPHLLLRHNGRLWMLA